MKKNKKSNLFFIFVKNSFRIFAKTKALIIFLGVLLFISATTLVVTFTTTFLLVKSKSNIISNGNLADLTVSLPTSFASSDNPQTFADSSTTDSEQLSPTALLEEYLRSQGFSFVLSKNLPVSDNINGKNFVVSQIVQPTIDEINPDGTTNLINQLVLQNGGTFPRNIDFSTITSSQKAEYFTLYRYYMNNPSTHLQKFFEYFKDFNTYIANKPWEFAQLLLRCSWNISQDFVDQVTPYLESLAKIPTNETEFRNFYQLFNFTSNQSQPTTVEEVSAVFNPNSYYAKLGALLTYNSTNLSSNFGASILLNQTIPLIGASGDIPFNVDIYQPSSYFCVLSSKYLSSNSDKQIINPLTIQDITALPYKQNSANGEYTNYLVHNPDGNGVSYHRDFLSWFAELDDKYKITVNSKEYGIVGSGDAPNLLYPALSSSQIFVDSKSSGVLYLNNSGFARLVSGSSYNPFVYYSVRYPPSIKNNLFLKQKSLSELKQFTVDNYGINLAYSLNDSTQPNFLLYLWSNFLNNTQRIFISIGSIIGGIVLILAFVFLIFLLQSIIKQNLTTFAIGLANGASKAYLAFSFFPFALVPALLFGTIAFVCSHFLTFPTLSVVSSYWTLSIGSPVMYVWIWAAIVLTIFVVLYVIIIALVFYMLSRSARSLLQDSPVFKSNKLIIWSQKFTGLFKPIWTFRLTLMVSNLTRFFTLLFIVITFITLTSVCASSVDVFKNSLANNLENKKYYSAIDLYSPTINSGYYSDIPYNELGTSQKGSFNSYDPNPSQNSNGQYSFDFNYKNPLDMQSNFYTGIDYYNALAYPYDDNKFFTSLFLTSSELSNEINWNARFLNNRVFNRLLLDVDINALGALINPWDFARQILPESIAYLANSNTQKLAESSYQFYYWLQQQNDLALSGIKEYPFTNLENTEFSQFNNVPITYSSYLPNVYDQPFTLDGSRITNDYATAQNKNEWIFIKEKDSISGDEMWVLNKQHAIFSAPTYTFRARTVALFNQILTNNLNPLYQCWYKNIYRPGALVVDDFNYKIAANMVPVNNNDETYTYINGSYIKDDDIISAKIIGIKPNSNFVNLYDKKNDDLKTVLSRFNNLSSDGDKIYPLVINNVVAKKWGLKIGSQINVSVENTFDRFNLKNFAVNASNPTSYIPYECKMEVVGITNTNYEEQYYILQSDANEILGYQDFTNASNVNWISSIQPGRGYIPFNGIFSNDRTLSFINNFGGFYTITGLSTILGDINLDSAGEIGALGTWLINNQYSFNKLMNINKYVDRKNQNKIVEQSVLGAQSFNTTILPSYTDEEKANLISEWMNKLSNIFETKSFFTSSFANIDLPLVTNDVANFFDMSLINVDVVIVLTFVTTLLIIISLISIIVVFESQRLIAILKVLGYDNLRTAFSLAFAYYFVLFFGTFISVPVVFTILEIVKLITFRSFNIILTPNVYWWVFVLGFVAVGGILSIILCYFYFKMKKMNPAKEIAVR